MFEVGGATTVCAGMGKGVVFVVVKTDDCAAVCGAKAGATADVVVTACAMNLVWVGTGGNCWSRVVKRCCCCVDTAMCDGTTQVLIVSDGPSVVNCWGIREDVVML